MQTLFNYSGIRCLSLSCCLLLSCSCLSWRVFMPNLSGLEQTAHCTGGYFHFHCWIHEGTKLSFFPSFFISFFFPSFKAPSTFFLSCDFREISVAQCFSHHKKKQYLLLSVRTSRSKASPVNYWELLSVTHVIVAGLKVIGQHLHHLLCLMRSLDNAQRPFC